MIQDNRMTFVELLRNNSILFPKIQRDYAQGRKKEKEVRQEFLKALFDYLHSDDSEHDLDFIYGTRRDSFFIPLDGQQRLTTLFLMHWYLANKFDRQQWDQLVFDDNQNSKFSYQTRPSSNSFCKELVKFNPFISMLSNDQGENNSISKTIKNQGWFFSSWVNDPTIDSMLTMIDEINDVFGCVEKDCFDRLFTKRWITFQMLYLDNFNLTDDLYIKMNARGVSLTVFETFKARLEQKIKSCFNDMDTAKRTIDSGEVELHEYFAYMIDTKWADLFWNYRNKNHIFDSELMNFIRVSWSSQYALNNPEESSLELLFDTDVAKRQKDYTKVLTFNHYDKLNSISYNSVEALMDGLNAISNGVDKITIYNIDEFYFDQCKIFEKVLAHDLTHPERVRFFAYISFLINAKKGNGDVNENELWQWMRIVYNLTENTPLDSATRCASAIQSINKMITRIDFSAENGVLNYIVENKIDFFAEVQVAEEKIKAILIKDFTGWSDKIYELEKHSYFKGQIGFVFDFAGISELYNQSDLKFSNYDVEKDYYNSFSIYADKVALLFDQIICDKSKIVSECLLERALLTKGDYLLNASSNRKNFANRIYHRDYSWKRFLRYDSDNIKQRDYFKELIDDNRFNKDSINKSLESIISASEVSDWRSYFIGCKELIKDCQQSFIRFIDHRDIILLGQSQMNHWHTEMYTRYLWYQAFEGKDVSFKPFNPEYFWSKSNEEDACIHLSNYCHNKKYYEINIYFCDNDKLPHPYEIAFKKSKGVTSKDKYDDEIKDILKKLRFEWIEGYEAFFFSCNNSHKLTSKLNMLIEELRSL